jgi:hypothetical protein
MISKTKLGFGLLWAAIAVLLIYSINYMQTLN